MVGSTEVLTTCAVAENKAALLHRLSSGVNGESSTLVFTPESQVPGSSTARLMAGTVEVDGVKIKCVLKIPSATVAGTDFFNFVYGSSEGVRFALSAAEKVSKRQRHSPEVALVQIAEKPESTTLQLDLPSDGSCEETAQFGFLMLEVPPGQWLHTVISGAVNDESSDTSSAAPLIEKAASVIGALQVSVSMPDDVTSNHPDQLVKWPKENGFDRALALYLGLKEFGDFSQIAENRIEAFLSDKDVANIKNIRSIFEQLILDMSDLFAQRQLEGAIVSGHGDTKLENWIVLTDENGEEHVIAMDALRFFDSEAESCRSWHIRDRQWDIAMLIVSAAVKVSNAKDIPRALSFLLDFQQQQYTKSNREENPPISEEIAFIAYSLYAFYVSADTMLRIALTSLTAQRYQEAWNYFSEVSRLLELGAAYAESQKQASHS